MTQQEQGNEKRNGKAGVTEVLNEVRGFAVELIDGALNALEKPAEVLEDVAARAGETVVEVAEVFKDGVQGMAQEAEDAAEAATDVAKRVREAARNTRDEVFPKAKRVASEFVFDARTQANRQGRIFRRWLGKWADRVADRINNRNF